MQNRGKLLVTRFVVLELLPVRTRVLEALVWCWFVSVRVCPDGRENYQRRGPPDGFQFGHRLRRPDAGRDRLATGVPKLEVPAVAMSGYLHFGAARRVGYVQMWVARVH